MRLSIVVPTFNSATWIKSYAEQLLQLKYGGVESIEIVVADDGCSEIYGKFCNN
jgi:glycosyltransferase involved in cell wall biosynthesis